jgi:hypothetical protein
MENENIIAGGKVKSWGVRYSVPAEVLKRIGVGVGDNVQWTLGERDGKKIAILEKADEEAKKDG